MKLLGALLLVSLAASNLRRCEGATELAAKGGVRHAYGRRRNLDQSQTQTEDMDHFNVTLENNELLHQLLSLMNSSSSTCTTASEPKPEPMDCSDIFAQGQTQNGIYKIFPLRNQLNQPLEILCDMEDGGGWTVFLLRDNASEHVNFTRNWNEYKEFFGSTEQEYWIGLENLHALTSSNRSYEVRFEAKAPGRSDTWEGHQSFAVASEDKGYQLTLGVHDERSTVFEFEGFGMNYGQKFSTHDNDNDKWGDGNCAKSNKDGWWHGATCSKIFPTGSHGSTFVLMGWSKEYLNRVKPTWLQFKIRPTI